MAITRVNSRDILDRTIKNVDIADNAEIDDTKLATIQTSGKVSNSATTGTPYATPNTLALRDTSGNCTFNSVHATQTVTADISVRSPSIEGTTSLSLTGTVLKPPVVLTRDANENSTMTGLALLEVTDTATTGTLVTTQFSTVVGTIETPPVNPKDLVNKEYVDSVAMAGSVTGDLVAGRVVLSTGLHTISDSGDFLFDPVAHTLAIQAGNGSIELTSVANGTMTLSADEFTLYSAGVDGTAFTVSCPDDNVLLSFHGRTPVGILPLVDTIPDPASRRSLLQVLADGMVSYGLFDDNRIVPTYPFTPVTVEQGGTGLSTLGAALQGLRVNAAGTGLEYATGVGTGNIAGSLTAGRVALSIDANTVGDDSGLLYDIALQNLTVAGRVAALNIFEASRNTALGYNAFNRAFNPSFAVDNVAIGYLCQSSLTTGSHNIGIGSHVHEHLTTGGSNIGLGGAQSNITTGSGNIGMGNMTQLQLTTGEYNIALGDGSQQQLTTGSRNIALGTMCQLYNQTGINNLSVGDAALAFVNGGNYNIGIGTDSGLTTGLVQSVSNALISGSYNTFVGYRAGQNTVTQLSNTTAIGNGAFVNASDTVALGNAAVTSVMAGSEGKARLTAGFLSLLGGQSSYANNAAAISGGLTAGQIYTVAGSNPRLLAIVF